MLGVGGAFVESLSGYFARLAREHFQKPGTFFHRQLLWYHHRRPSRIGEFCVDDTGLARRHSMTLPGAAVKWISLLTRLTEVDNLAATTFIPWKDTFPYRGFLKTYLAYCPHCYDADGDDPYERLLWSLASVTVCPIHRCRLLENCPRCGTHIPAITYKSNPSRCPFDDSSLKDASHLTPIDSVDDKHPDLWAAQQCASLVEHFQSTPKHEYDLAVSFRHFAESAGLNDAAHLSRFLGCSRITAYYWMSGRVRPPLAIVLHFCRMLGLDVLGLLQLRASSMQVLMKVMIPNERTASQRARSADSDIETRAWRILSESTFSPPSLTALAALLGTNPKYLRKRYPDLTHQTVDNHIAHRKHVLNQLEERLTEEIREICHDLTRMGLKPTRRRISSKLSLPGAFRWPQLQTAADKIIQSFGF